MTTEIDPRFREAARIAMQKGWPLAEAIRRAVMTEREYCARKVEKLGMEGYGTLAIAGMIREQIDD